MPEFRGKKHDNASILDRCNAKTRRISAIDTRLNDSGMLELARKCPRLEQIAIRSEIVTSIGINAVLLPNTLRSLLVYSGVFVDDCIGEGLGQSTELRELYLMGTGISDAIIPVIGGLNRLWSLSLSSTIVSDYGVSSLGKLDSLSRLDLEDTHVNGMCLSRLPDFERLHLFMDGTPVTERCLIEYASTHTNTELLSLSRCRVGDGCLPAIFKLPRLSELRLSFTGVTEKGIDALCAHRELRVLYIEGLGIGERVVRDLVDKYGGRLIVYR